MLVTRRKNAYYLFHSPKPFSIVRHKLSATRKHLRTSHNQRKKDLHEQFPILTGNLNAYFMKCSLSKEKNLNWTLHPTQLRKQFSTQLTLSTFHIVEILTRCKETLTRFLSIKKTHRNLRLLEFEKWWTNHWNVISINFRWFLFLILYFITELKTNHLFV